jgi:hypothetical protein
VCHFTRFCGGWRLIKSWTKPFFMRGGFLRWLDEDDDDDDDDDDDRITTPPQNDAPPFFTYLRYYITTQHTTRTRRAGPLVPLPPPLATH